MPRSKLPYPPEFRREAVGLVRVSEKPVAQVARDLGVSSQTLHTWIKQADVDAGKREGLSTEEREELRRANSPLAALDIFDRMGGANYMATTLVHRRDGAPEPTRDDLMRLAKDLRELEGKLVCDQCGKAVWHLTNDNSRQCECGALKA